MLVTTRDLLVLEPVDELRCEKPVVDLCPVRLLPRGSLGGLGDRLVRLSNQRCQRRGQRAQRGNSSERVDAPVEQCSDKDSCELVR